MWRSRATGPGEQRSGSGAAPEAAFFWEEASRPEALVDLDEIRPGGPPPDGIPPIDAPRFVAAHEVEWLHPKEPVIALVHEGEARAYPLQILTWHEIVNDEVAGLPVTVTFCPLCNTAIAFDRRVEAPPGARARLGTGDAVLDFGTSGRLYRSNLVMYDRQTKSLWIQFTGRAVVGPFLGTDLENVPVQIVPWGEVRAAHPQIRVLSRDTGFDRPYGRNPYPGYDDVDRSPFLYDGPVDGRLRAMERVVALRHGDAVVAYPLASLLGRRGPAVHHDEVGGRDIVVFASEGTLSALDGQVIAESKDVGTAGVFEPRVDGRRLSFRVRGGRIVDEETASEWNVLGEAVAGPLARTRLAKVVHDQTFWFVWAAFEPNTVTRRP